MILSCFYGCLKRGFERHSVVGSIPPLVYSVAKNHIPTSRSMFVFTVLTAGLFIGLASISAYMNVKEVSSNWSKYKSDPLYMFTAFMFKPEDDPRSRLQFAADNFINNIMDFVHKLFEVFLQPVMKIFRMFTDSLMQSAQGLFNIRMILGKMWTAFNQMTDIFMRRFYGVFHQLRVTFIKLNESIGKTFGAVISSVYAALSTIRAMTSVFDLMINICVAILIILAVFMIFLPFLLIPFILLILMVTKFIDASGQGGQLTGLAGVFCFTPDTKVSTASGPTPISDVKLGTILADGQQVTGVFVFHQAAKDIYILHGVKVSGSHIVYKDNKPYHVCDHPDAIPYTDPVNKVYCLMTSDRRIPIVSDAGIIHFADWEELDDEDEGLESWNSKVYSILNKKSPVVKPSAENIHSESCFTGNTEISTIFGLCSISNISPGMYVNDGFGNMTRVTGVVRIAGTEVTGYRRFHSKMTVSAGAWIFGDGVWMQPSNIIKSTHLDQEQTWYSLFTESGTFLIGNEHVVRDFTDVGSDTIHETYDMVMDELKKKL